jgi:hypothetical protein
MPKSKHRRKPGDKSVRRPGSNKPARVSPVAARDRAYVRFLNVYRQPFREDWPDQDAASEMLDIVSDAVFNLDTLSFHAVNKDVAFQVFVQPCDAEDGSFLTRTSENAEAALGFLLEQQMVVVNGDMISIHPMFADMFASSDAKEGPALMAPFG